MAPRQKNKILLDGIKLLPLLLIYLGAIFIFSNSTLEGDELRYMLYAENILQGYFTESDNPWIRNGPGYPIFLAIFLKLNLPIFPLKLLNAVLIFLGSLMIFQTFLIYFSKSKAVLLAYLVGLYPPLVYWASTLYSESLAFFACCGFILYFIRYVVLKQSSFDLLLSCIFLLGLVMTKLIFGYVILVFSIASFLYFIVIRSAASKRFVLVFVSTFFLCIPYLTYTYSLTGRPFMWSTNGGELIYWMASPFENEWGNWIGRDRIGTLENSTFHSQVFDSIDSLSHLAQSDTLMNLAINNIKMHPSNYLKNLLANQTRFYFNFPKTGKNQSLRELFYILPNMVILLSLLFSLVVGTLRYKLIPPEILVLFLFFSIYYGGISLIHSSPRYLISILPVLLLSIFVTFHHTTTFMLKPSSKCHNIFSSID